MTTFRLRLPFYAMIYNQDTRGQGWKHGLPAERLLNLNHDPIEYFEKDMMGCFHREKKRSSGQGSVLIMYFLMLLKNINCSHNLFIKTLSEKQNFWDREMAELAA